MLWLEVRFKDDLLKCTNRNLILLYCSYLFAGLSPPPVCISAQAGPLSVGLRREAGQASDHIPALLAASCGALEGAAGLPVACRARAVWVVLQSLLEPFLGLIL